jgi:hypothetical protein
MIRRGTFAAATSIGRPLFSLPILSLRGGPFKQREAPNIASSHIASR